MTWCDLFHYSDFLLRSEKQCQFSKNKDLRYISLNFITVMGPINKNEQEDAFLRNLSKIQASTVQQVLGVPHPHPPTLILTASTSISFPKEISVTTCALLAYIFSCPKIPGNWHPQKQPSTQLPHRPGGITPRFCSKSFPRVPRDEVPVVQNSKWLSNEPLISPSHFCLTSPLPYRLSPGSAFQVYYIWILRLHCVCALEADRSGFHSCGQHSLALGKQLLWGP